MESKAYQLGKVAWVGAAAKAIGKKLPSLADDVFRGAAKAPITSVTAPAITRAVPSASQAVKATVTPASFAPGMGPASAETIRYGQQQLARQRAFAAASAKDPRHYIHGPQSYRGAPGVKPWDGTLPANYYDDIRARPAVSPRSTIPQMQPATPAPQANPYPLAPRQAPPTPASRMAEWERVGVTPTAPATQAITSLPKGRPLPPELQLPRATPLPANWQPPRPQVPISQITPTAQSQLPAISPGVPAAAANYDGFVVPGALAAYGGLSAGLIGANQTRSEEPYSSDHLGLDKQSLAFSLGKAAGWLGGTSGTNVGGQFIPEVPMVRGPTSRVPDFSKHTPAQTSLLQSQFPMLKQSAMGVGPQWDRYASNHPLAAGMGPYNTDPEMPRRGPSPKPGPALAFPKAPPTMSGFGNQFGDLLRQMQPPSQPTAPSPTTAAPGGGWWNGAKQFAGNALGFAGGMAKDMLHPDNLLHPATGMAPWALSKVMPKGPGAVSNAWNNVRPAVAPAWNAIQPTLAKTPLVGRFMPGAMGAGTAPATAFGMGAARTAGLAGYGAYVAGDVPYAGYQLATGQANLRERSADQLNAEGNMASRYAQNVGGNLMRPGMATLDYLSTPGTLAQMPGEYMRGRSLDAQLAAARKRHGM